MPEPANEISSTRLSTTVRRCPMLRPEKRLLAMVVFPSLIRNVTQPHRRGAADPGIGVSARNLRVAVRSAAVSYQEAGRIDGVQPAGFERAGRARDLGCQHLAAERGPADAARAQGGADGQTGHARDEARL